MAGARRGSYRGSARGPTATAQLPHRAPGFLQGGAQRPHNRPARARQSPTGGPQGPDRPYGVPPGPYGIPWGPYRSRAGPHRGLPGGLWTPLGPYRSKAVAWSALRGACRGPVDPTGPQLGPTWGSLGPQGAYRRGVGPDGGPIGGRAPPTSPAPPPETCGKPNKPTTSTNTSREQRQKNTQLHPTSSAKMRHKVARKPVTRNHM